MGVRERPVTDDEFKRVLKHLGFTPRPQKSGTSHVQWVKGDGSSFLRVTVDSHHQPYQRGLLASMLKQAGLSKKTFFEALEAL